MFNDDYLFDFGINHYFNEDSDYDANASINCIALNKGMEEVYKELRQHKIPEKYPDEIKDFIFCYDYDKYPFIIREKFTNEFGFTLVANSWLRPLSERLKGKKCLEIMCGTAMISKGLQDLGIDCIATDNLSWVDKAWFENDSNLFTDVENIDCVDAIKKYGKEIDYIICSWPPYREQIIYDALLEMRKQNPNCQIIYIGEDCGGCTACDDFFEDLETVIDSWSLPENDKFQRWAGIHDMISIVK